MWLITDISSTQIVPGYLHAKFPPSRIDSCLLLQSEHDHSNCMRCEGKETVQRLRAKLPAEPSKWLSEKQRLQSHLDKIITAVSHIILGPIA